MLEYSLFVATFVAALSVMDIYYKRAVQGHLKASTDGIGEQFSAENSDYSYVLTQKKKTFDTVAVGGAARSVLLEPEIVHKSSYVDNFSDKKLSEEKLFE